MKKIITTLMLTTALFAGTSTFQSKDSQAGIIIMALGGNQNHPAAFYAIGGTITGGALVGSGFVIHAALAGTFSFSSVNFIAAASALGTLIVADASGSLENNSLENALRAEIPEVSEPAMIRDLAAALKAEANGKTTDSEGKLFVQISKDQVRDILSNSAQLDAATIEIVAERLSN
jgi:hypothetical protein